MPKTLFSLLLLLHGAIHVLGFVKAFNIATLKELTLPISKSQGLLWLLTFILFCFTLVQYLMKGKYWWLIAIIAVIVSQVVIILFWNDAKFGTIPNIIILLVSIVGLAQFSFHRKVNQEINSMFSQISADNSLITAEMTSGVPKPVQKWLHHSGIIGKERISTVRLKQKIQMKMKPEQKKWTQATAEQYFTIENPAFVWHLKMQMARFIPIAGRDKFNDGKGEMLIKALSLFPVAKNGNNEKINMGTIQRYLAEIIWFPSAALSPYISWEAIDEFSAKAIMTYKGTTGSGIFHFDQDGNFVGFNTKRYLGDGEDAELRDWIITVNETKEINGIIIPVKSKVTWKLNKGDWTWLKIGILDLEYNQTNEY